MSSWVRCHFTRPVLHVILGGASSLCASDRSSTIRRSHLTLSSCCSEERTRIQAPLRRALCSVVGFGEHGCQPTCFHFRSPRVSHSRTPTIFWSPGSCHGPIIRLLSPWGLPLQLFPGCSNESRRLRSLGNAGGLVARPNAFSKTYHTHARVQFGRDKACLAAATCPWSVVWSRSLQQGRP